MSLKINNYRPPTQSDMVSWQTHMRTAFFEAVRPDDMREIVAGLVSKAKKGDMGAIKVLLAYGIGSATVQVQAQNAMIVQGDAGVRAPTPLPLPAEPTRALPATEAKIEAMARRAAAGQDVFDPRDRKVEG